MTFYRVNTHSTKVVIVNADRASESSIFWGSRRVKRVTNYESYFPTRQEAVDWKLRELEREIDTARRTLDARLADKERFENWLKENPE